jgi:glycosyltransferase involved in cell wall biosynthesis
MSTSQTASENRARGAAVQASRRPRICFVVSSPMTVEAFLTDQIRALGERYEVHLALNADAGSLRHPALRGITVHRVRIERAISPLHDLRGLLQLVRLLRAHGFAAIHSVTPKAGLLAAIAGFVSRVPVRVHTHTGQVWATRKGLARTILKALDRVIARLDTHVLVDSVSQRDFLRAQGVLTASQGEVLGCGSVSGVDGVRFRPDAASREAIRGELSIPSSARVFLFVGRLNRDKGVLDLASAFERVARERDTVFLIYVGPDEDLLAPDIRSRCGHSASRVRFVSWTEAVERYMAASDVFCLPSYREGFGSVVIEAAAAGLPAIGSRIYGIVDAIEDGKTGLLFSVGRVPELAAAMATLAADDEMRGSMGKAARTRALRDFSRETLTSALVAFYERILARTKGESRQELLRSHFD